MKVSRNGVGAASVMMILTVVLLTVFGVLALTSAQADRNLTDKTVQRTTAYYLAQEKAQRLIQQADEALARGELPEESLRLQVAETGLVYISIPVSDGDELAVVLSPSEDGYRILQYQWHSLRDWDAGTEVDFYDGHS